MIKQYFLRHLQVLFYCLGQLWRSKVSTLMSASVIGISLALPTGFYLLLLNAQEISSGWDGDPQISVFLKTSVNDAAARKLAREIGQQKDVGEVQYISPEKALAEFKQASGFGDALKMLDENPLPGVLLVRPASNAQSTAQLKALQTKLANLAETDLAQLDLEWVKRLYTMIELATRGVMLVALLLALGVLLIIGNTIRLAIYNRRDEIEINKLIGATNGFIRRPFLYTGLLYGFIGSVMALVLVEVFILTVSNPAANLSSLYGSSFQISGLSFTVLIQVLALGSGLGLLGAWIAVRRHLKDIQPG